MISQAPLDFEPYDEEPRRFTPLLIIAGAVVAVAVLVIAFLLFTGGGPGPSPSPSTPSTSGSPVEPTDGEAPEPTGTPDATDGPEPTEGPGGAAEFAEGVCAAPLPPFDRLSVEVLSGFTAYCLDAVAAVVTERSFDPTTVQRAGWAFAAAEGGDVDSAVFSRVYLVLDGDRRPRRFSVAHSSTGAPSTVVGEVARPRQLADPLLVYLWERPSGG